MIKFVFSLELTIEAKLTLVPINAKYADALFVVTKTCFSLLPSSTPPSVGLSALPKELAIKPKKRHTMDMNKVFMGMDMENAVLDMPGV